MSQPQKFDIAKFYEGFQQADQDLVLIALQELYKYLVAHLDFIIDNPQQLQSVYIPSIIKRLSSPLHTEIIIRIIPQFVAKLPSKFLPYLFNEVFEYLNKEYVPYFSNIGGVLEDSISIASRYSEDRQVILVESLFSKLVAFIRNSENPQLKDLSLKLLTNLIVAIPNRLSEENLSALKKLIEELVTESATIEDHDDIPYLTLIASISSLAKVYCSIVSNENLVSMLDYIQSITDKSLSTYIISNIIIYRPQLFDPKTQTNAKYQYTEYSAIIRQRLNDERSADEDEENELGKCFITFAVSYLDALRSIVSTFGDLMTNEELNPYLEVHFSFLTFNAHPIYDEGNEETVPVLAGGEDEPVDAVFDSSDDSYQIRVASINLGIEIVSANHSLYFDSISYYNEEENINSAVYIDDLLHDDDIGCKLPAIRFLRILIHAYKKELDNAIIIEWSESVLSQISQESKNEHNCQFIDALTYIINERKSLPSLDIILRSLEIVKTVYKNQTATSIFHLLSAILMYSSDSSIAKPVSEILVMSLNDKQSTVLKICLTIVSRLYLYYRQNCNKKATIGGLLNGLNKIVLDISKQNGENKIYGVMALSVFVVCNSTQETVNDSVGIIVNTLQDSAYAKTTISAVSLIAASESYSLLEPHISVICQYFQEGLKNLDSSIVYRSLWGINLLLQKKLLTKDQCTQLAASLLSMIEKEYSKLDNNTMLLIMKNLNLLQPQGYDRDHLSKFQSCFINVKLTDEILSEVSRLIFESSKQSLANVQGLIESLVEKSPQFKDETIIRNIASIIGYASFPHLDYAKQLITSFIDLIRKNTNAHFSLRCIGEIGSHLDLSTQQDLVQMGLVDLLFDLVHNPNREIFVPAAEATGLISIGSETVLEYMLATSQKDDLKFFPVWLIGYQALINKSNQLATTTKNIQSVISKVSTIAEYLLGHADEQKETSVMVSQCLAGLAGLASFAAGISEFTESLIKIHTPIAYRAIDIYMENYSTYNSRVDTHHILTAQEKEEILNLINSMQKELDFDNPILCQNFFMCLRYALQQGLQQDLIDDTFEAILICANKRNSHLQTESKGVIMSSVDLGITLRALAFECASLFIKGDQVNYLISDFVDLLDITLISEPVFEIRQNCLDCIALLASIPNRDCNEVIKNGNTINALVSMDRDIKAANPPASKEVNASFIEALLSLRQLYGREAPSDLENLYQAHKDDPELKQAEDERSYSHGKANIHDRLFSLGYAGSILMSEFFPAATGIFA